MPLDNAIYGQMERSSVSSRDMFPAYGISRSLAILGQSSEHHNRLSNRTIGQ